MALRTVRDKATRSAQASILRRALSALEVCLLILLAVFAGLAALLSEVVRHIWRHKALAGACLLIGFLAG